MQYFTCRNNGVTSGGMFIILLVKGLLCNYDGLMWKYLLPCLCMGRPAMSKKAWNACIYFVLWGGAIKKKDFPLKPVWSHEIGATESVIAPQSPPVNTYADKQMVVFQLAVSHHWSATLGLLFIEL